MNKLTKCTKRLPATCRIHGKAYLKAKEERQALQDAVKKQVATVRMSQDIDKSWTVKEKNGITTLTVYRSGVPEVLPHSERGVEAGAYQYADAVKPDGRSGRIDSMCVSPTLGGVARWVYANSFSSKHADFRARQLEVDVDRTYIYNIRAWEVASSKEQEMVSYGPPVTDENSPYHDYWNTGMTVREYMEKARSDPEKYSPQDWEILLNSDEQPQKPKPVSFDRVADAMWTDQESDKQGMRDFKKQFRTK